MANSQFLHSFCTKDIKQATFSQTHSKDVEDFLGKWGKWISEKGVFTDSYNSHLLILISGLGSIKPNEGGDENEGSEDLASNEWMKLLNEDDGVYSLKPWKEAMKASKHNLSLALREIMRQAWSEYYTILIILFCI
jgi:hypothetical protein